MNLYDCKILLIDDNEELVSMIRGILKKSGFENIYTAGNCGSGLEVFLREEPQLVILDIMLPDGDVPQTQGRIAGADSFSFRQGRGQ